METEAPDGILHNRDRGLAGGADGRPWWWKETELSFGHVGTCPGCRSAGREAVLVAVQGGAGDGDGMQEKGGQAREMRI